MALTDLLKSFVRGVTLSAALYSCGGEEKEGCQTDYDCREPRVCVRGYCEGGNGEGNGSSNGGGTCGDSILNGKYLNEVTGYDNCSESIKRGKGSPTEIIGPGDPATCTLEEDIVYSGLTVGGSDCELIRDLQCSGYKPDEQTLCRQQACRLASNENLYVLDCHRREETLNGILIDSVLISNSYLISQDSLTCNQIAQQAWYRDYCACDPGDCKSL